MKIDQFSRAHAKALLKGAVERKKTLSKERRHYKLRTRTIIDRVAETKTGEYGDGTKWSYDVPTEAWKERMHILHRFDAERYGTKCDIRYLHLARALMKGLPYHRVEKKTNTKPWDQNVIGALKKIFGGTTGPFTTTNVRDWLEGRPVHQKQKAVA